MQEQNPSAKRPSGWRGARLVAGTLALTMGALGAGLAATALPASATATTNTYAIGSLTGSVTNVTISPTSTTANAAESEELFFTGHGCFDQLQHHYGDVRHLLGAVTAVQVIDHLGPLLENVGSPPIVGDTFTITLPAANCTIAAGNTVQSTSPSTPPSPARRPSRSPRPQRER